MKTYTLKLTAAIALAGAIVKAGSLVDVDEPVAKNLLHRGKARVATTEDLTAAGREVAADTDADTDAPTREQLDAALAALPGEYKDADYVVNQMRAHWGDVFTDADEAKVRELVKTAAADTTDTATTAKGGKRK